MKPLTISYFGCIDQRYSRNKTNVDGLRQAGVTVYDVVVNTPVTRLNSAEDTSALALIKRVLHKFTMIPEVITKRREIAASDAIFVGYPGQFDMPIAYLTAKLFGKKLIFDPVILMFNALSNDIGVITNDGFVTRALKAYEKFVMRLPDLVIASTIEQKKFFIDQTGVNPNKIAVAYLAADDAIYHPGTKKLTDPRYRVVYYGLFTPLHGVPHIIEAARISAKKDPKIVFQMVGKGQLYEESRKRAKELKLKNIEFYPDMNESNSMELLQAGNVFLGFLETNSTALREIPNKVYQGLALEKVVITGDSPAIRSVLDDRKSIYLVPPGNGKALANAILFLSKHRATSQKIAEAGHALFLKHYTVRAVGKVMKKAIQEKM